MEFPQVILVERIELPFLRRLYHTVLSTLVMLFHLLLNTNPRGVDNQF